VSSARDAGRAGLAAAGVRLSLDVAARPRPVRWPPASALTVEELMREGFTASPGDRLPLVAAIMRRACAGAMAVVANGRLVGLISEQDVLRAVADGLSTDALTVADYVRPAPIAIEAAARASDAAARMVAARAHHLPVLRDDRLVGMISGRDLLAGWGVPRELLGEEPW
jgi:CBS domain-containing protein